MARREPLTNEQRRLPKITGRMPLASVVNLASASGATEDRVRGPCWAACGGGGWIILGGAGHDRKTQAAPLVLLTSQAVDLLYVNDHQHPSPGRKQEPQAWPPSTPRANCPRTFRSVSPWTTTTNTRPGPPRRGASRPRSGGWPCWSRSTAWFPT